MAYLYLIGSLAAGGCMIAEAWLIGKRNRTILISGKRDKMALTLAALALILLFPVNQEAPPIQGLCCIMVLGAIMGSLGVRSGFTQDGLTFLLTTVSWDAVKEVYLEAAGVKYMLAKVAASRRVFCLRFPVYRLNEVTEHLQKHDIKVYIKKQ